MRNISMRCDMCEDDHHWRSNHCFEQHHHHHHHHHHVTTHTIIARRTSCLSLTLTPHPSSIHPSPSFLLTLLFTHHRLNHHGNHDVRHEAPPTSCRGMHADHDAGSMVASRWDVMGCCIVSHASPPSLSLSLSLPSSPVQHVSRSSDQRKIQA